ncbi:MAG: hypothetical protein OXH57_05805 [Ekhidna sp.]|nr:hypothetical protein [Ekhidna sp.]
MRSPCKGAFLFLSSSVGVVCGSTGSPTIDDAYLLEEKATKYIKAWLQSTLSLRASSL